MVNQNEASAAVINSTDINDYLMPEPANLKRKTLVGPWKYIGDFKKVYDWLFCEANNQTQLLANKEMCVWMNRRGHLCPAGVTATNTILDVLLKDATNMYNVADMQTFYAFALIRFVNYMVSTEHTHNIRSMYDIARDIGLWTLVIDVRHVCAHDLVLPNLKLFREVTNYCMSWIKDYYWRPLYMNMLELSSSEVRSRDETKDDRNINQLFDIYNAAFEGCLRGATNVKNSKKFLHKRPRSFENLKSYYQHKNLTDLESVLNAVVADLSRLSDKNIYMDDFEDIYDEAFFNMHCFLNFTEFYNPVEHIKTIISLTQSLFRFLANYGLIRKIFEHLISIAERQFHNEVQRASAGFWAEQIAKGFLAFKKYQIMHDEEMDKNTRMKQYDLTEINAGTISNYVKKLLLYSGTDLEQTLIFGSSKLNIRAFTFTYEFLNERMNNICEYTAPAMKSLLNILDPSLDKTTFKELKLLVDVLCGVTIDSNNKANAQNDDITEAKTVEDLYEIAHNNSIQIKNKATSKKNEAHNKKRAVPNEIADVNEVANVKVIANGVVDATENIVAIPNGDVVAAGDVEVIANGVAMADADIVSNVEAIADVDSFKNAAKVRDAIKTTNVITGTAEDVATNENNPSMEPCLKRKKIDFDSCEFDWMNCALGRLPWE